MIPQVSVKKSTVGGTPAIQASQGIAAFIASSAYTGTAQPPTMLTNQALAVSSFVGGMIPECAVYEIDTSGNPCLALAVTCSVTGTYGAITSNITGTATVAAGSTQPLLHYDVAIAVIAGGNVGTSGITYTYTVDGGDDVVGPVALGTSATLAIPGTGVSFTLSPSGGSLNAGDGWSCFTERPMLSNADMTTALATLGNTRLPWEGVYVDAHYGTGSVAILDSWLAARETNGQFNFGVLNTRFLNEPAPTAESPATYAAAIIAQSANDVSNRLCLCADGGHLTSLITGFTTKMPTGLALMAMAMSVTPNLGTDPAYVALGPVPGFEISANGNPQDWDEFLYQSLDSQRLTTLRSFGSAGPAGCFITDANVLISTGSNIYWLQLLRVLNKACAIAWAILNTQLSKGVRTVYNQQTGAINIDPRDAQTIESLVDGPLTAGLSGQCTAAGFTMNRDDNLAAPKAPVNCDVSVVPLVYLKSIVVTAALVKTIAAPTGGA